MSSNLLLLHRRNKPKIEYNFLLGSLPSGTTFSRASNATMFDSAGKFVVADANMLPNGDFVGSSAPSTFPTGWVNLSSQGGITVSVEGSGVENGVPYVDIHYEGTASDTGSSLKIFAGQGATSASVGQTHTVGLAAKLQSGSLTGVIVIGITSREYNGLTGLGAGFATTNITLTSTKTAFSRTYACTDANVTQLRWGLRVQATNGAAISLTIRLYQGQQNLGTTLNPYHSTNGTAWYAPRFDTDPSTLAAKGLLLEEQRTNSIPNNTMQGTIAGTPGTLPTGWNGYTGSTGLMRTIVGFGLSDPEYGMPYIDMRFSGTPTATNKYQVLFSSGIAAVQNETWTASVFAKVIAGSLANFSNVNLGITQNSSGGWLEDTWTAAGLTTSLTRPTLTKTLNQASCANIYSVLAFYVTNGQAVDVTVRMYAPQTEKGSGTTSVIPTYGSAATRAADSLYTTNTARLNKTEGTFVVEFVPEFISAINATAVGVSDGSSGNAISMYTQPNGQSFAYTTTGPASVVSTASLSAGSVVKLAYGYKEGSNLGVQNGVNMGGSGLAAFTTSAIPPLGTTPRIDFMNRYDGARPYSAWLRNFKGYNTRKPDAFIQQVTQ